MTGTVLDMGRLTYRVALLLDPQRPVRALGRRPSEKMLVVIALGVRHVAQAAASLVVHRRWILVASAGIDAAHAATAVVLAASDRRWRAAGTLDAGIAASLAAAGAWSAGAAGGHAVR